MSGTLLPEVTPALLAFIARHRDTPVEELLLRTPPFPAAPMAFVVQQVQARRELRQKLPRWVSSDAVLFPARLAWEQASSQHTATYKAEWMRTRLARHERFADLTCGLGVDTTLLAELFAEGDACERNAELAAIVRHNLRAFGLDARVRVHELDALDWLDAQPNDAFDLLYVDPARRDSKQRRVTALADCSPDVTHALPQMLAKSASVLLKAAPMLDIDLACRQLGSVSAVHIVSSQGECKELLFLLRRDPAAEIVITAADGDVHGAWSSFAFTRTEERRATSIVAAPAHFLFEPSPALLKAGAFKLVGVRFEVNKLHANTHLYTAEAHRSGFPGRVWAIEARASCNPKGARSLFPDGRASLIARNAGAGADDLRKRLGLRDGGECVAIAARCADERVWLFRARPVRDGGGMLLDS